jgi:hypothetical protein
MNSSRFNVRSFFRDFVGVVFVLEGDGLVLALQLPQPMVGDANAVGVAREIRQHGLGAGKGTFGIHAERLPMVERQTMPRGVSGHSCPQHFGQCQSRIARGPQATRRHGDGSRGRAGGHGRHEIQRAFDLRQPLGPQV